MFEGGIARIPVLNVMAAHLISTLSLESFSRAITSVGVVEEWKTNVPDLFTSLSMRISSKPSFTFKILYRILIHDAFRLRKLAESVTYFSFRT